VTLVKGSSSKKCGLRQFLISSIKFKLDDLDKKLCIFNQIDSAINIKSDDLE
jgi:hypothetical protein